MMKSLLAKIALIGAMAVAVTVTSAPQLHAESDSQERGLKGSWEIQITQPNLDPLPFGLDFRILRTVTEDGVVDAYAFPGFGAQGPQPGLVSNPGHGTWKHASGRRKYSAVVKYFQLDQSAFPYVLHSTGKVTEEISVSKDGDSYTSTFVTEIFNPSGQLIFTNYGGTIAKRIK